MKMTPNLISAYELEEGQFSGCAARISNGTYKVARPISAPTFAERIVWAWRVFTGRYDALVWPGQEPQP